MNKFFLKSGALIGTIAVALGAFGAHYFKTKLETESLAVFQTGVHYMFLHGIALLLTGILSGSFRNKMLFVAGNLFFIGVLIFSGSLFLITVGKLVGSDSFKIFGIVAPVGGLSFILGWLSLFYSFLEKPGRELEI